MHNCDNKTCHILNPCLERLLAYQDLRNRITKVEEIFFHNLRHRDKFAYSPLELFGWANYHYVWQFLNLEFIQELANKIRKIAPDTILEVGAGRGLLGKYLGEELNREIITTDDYSWWEKDRIDDVASLENNVVIKMDYKEAIETYSPDLIIVSWIPYKKEWVKDFREYGSVKGYIIIGEYRGGCTGNDNDWNTNWKIESLDNIERFGLCRSDHGFISGDPILHTNVEYYTCTSYRKFFSPE